MTSAWSPGLKAASAFALSLLQFIECAILFPILSYPHTAHAETIQSSYAPAPVRFFPSPKFAPAADLHAIALSTDQYQIQPGDLLPLGKFVGPEPDAGFTRLPGHVLRALTRATPVIGAARGPDDQMRLTIVLKRDDPAGFENYLHAVYDSKSPQFKHYLKPTQLASRFGPSRRVYGELAGYLERAGMAVERRSKDRQTLTVRASRSQVEHAFALGIVDYRVGAMQFYANNADPALPQSIAQHVQGISGLSNYAKPQSTAAILTSYFFGLSCIFTLLGIAAVEIGTAGAALIIAGLAVSVVAACVALLYAWGFVAYDLWQKGNLLGNLAAAPRDTASDPKLRKGAQLASRAQNIVGSGQTIGLLEFDSFAQSDVGDLLTLLAPILNTSAQPPSLSNLSVVPVNGGATPGANQDEVLLDIDTVMMTAPGAKVAVYDAPPSGRASDYVDLFTAMINDGVTVISNSWASCEDQMSQADAMSIDAVLQTAAAAGISVFNGTGDKGSTCIDGSPNTVAVPADSPHATAVGGSSLAIGPGLTYGGESWWNGTAGTPPSGQGGYGVSQYFAAPSYQGSFTNATGRSVPDVVANADPQHGVAICQASGGGCPNGNFYGGTSYSTPQWAAFTALLNQKQGKNVGFLNPLIYPLGNTAAFHNAASMQSDFSHVGLGSPNLRALDMLLKGQSPGVPVASSSTLINMAAAQLGIIGLQVAAPADGATQAVVVAQLLDADGYPVPGKTVTLAANGGSAIISPAAGATTDGNGNAVFKLTDLAIETIIFTATDTSDGVTVSQTASVTFGAPPAASAGISVNATSEPADGQTAATITVTLQDSLGRPSPGKVVTLADSGAHAVITGPASGVTGSNGQIQFQATDQINETVTFTATDVTDSDLAIPGSATVTYSDSTTSACNANNPPVAASGYAVTPFMTGMPAAATVFYGDVNFGCPGAGNPAFTSAGAVLSADFLTGAIYQSTRSGGAMSSANIINTLGPTTGNLIYGKDGSLYALQSATGGGLSSGTIVQISPTTGAVLRTLASGLTCPAGMAVDPLSGDLFFDDECTGAGTDNPSIWRVIDPANTNASQPTSVVVYATLPTTPNGGMAFAPNGTLYAVSGYFGNVNAPVEQISGTNAGAVTVTPVAGITSDFGVAIGTVNAGGAAQSLIVEPAGVLSEVPIANPSSATVLASVSPGVGVTGPDGCLYSGRYDTIYRLTSSNGTCSFAPTSPAPALSLSPATVSPNPAQGTPVTLTATLSYVSSPAGVPVLFTVSGANSVAKQIMSNGSGVATFSYTAVHPGSDTVVANAPSGSSTLNSNVVAITWTSGLDTTFLSLNLSATAGIAGTPVMVTAALSDISANPATALANQSVTLTLGGSSCTATTNTSGQASCSLTPAQAGASTLSAAFSGTSMLLASTASVGFNVAAAATPPTVIVTGSAKSGGGSLDWSALLLLALVALLRRRRRGIAGSLLLGCLLFIGGNHTASAQQVSAAGDSGSPSWYLGVRAGSMQQQQSDSTINQGLAAAGYGTVLASVKNSAASGTAYLGYALTPLTGIEAAFTYRSATTAHLSGTLSTADNPAAVAQTVAKLVTGYGDIYSLSYRAHIALAPGWTLDPRLGGYVWNTKVTADITGGGASATHTGGGVTAGLGVAYRVWSELELGAGVDYFDGSSSNRSYLLAASLEWRMRN